jgi:PKD repeat protein
VNGSVPLAYYGWSNDATYTSLYAPVLEYDNWAAAGTIFEKITKISVSNNSVVQYSILGSSTMAKELTDGGSVTFNDTSTANPIKRLWRANCTNGSMLTFMDSTLQNVTQPFSIKSGESTANCSILETVNSSYQITSGYLGNQTAYGYGWVNISASGGAVAPVGNIACSPLVIDRNATVSCTGSSDGTSWDWFGGAGIPCMTGNSTNQNPTIFPLNWGPCSICQKATNAGGSNTTCKTDYIYVRGPRG